VIGEPHRAFGGNQYGLTFPIFDHYGVALWVPEVSGPIDPANEAHNLVMSVFGGMSKGERNRDKIRVRTAMAAQAQTEGRFLADGRQTVNDRGGRGAASRARPRMTRTQQVEQRPGLLPVPALRRVRAGQPRRPP
jgi:hypothetical protein